ncbi:MAG TPA: flagellar filament capping protein FliD [Steroidobacteraceae bacterium]|jgi:flagellar hook-associated protein 2
MATVPDSTSSSLSSTILGSLGSLSGGASTVGANNLNVTQLVSQLVAADRAPKQSILDAQKATDTAQLSALSTLKSALAQFQLASQALATPSAFNSSAAASSNPQVLTATTDASAGTGTYTVQVVALAESEQLASGAISGGASGTVGTGALTIGQGSASFTVNIDSTDNSLQGIANAINGANGNTGVQATILNEANGAHLLLTSSKTGASQAITVTAAGGDGGLNQLNYNSTTKNMTELQPAQDSHIKIGTFDHYASSNAVSDAVTGVTFNLVSASPGTNVTLSVNPDNSGISNLVGQFVSAYNTLQSTMSSLDSYDSSSNTAGPLLGDAALSGIETQIRQDLSDAVTAAPGVYNSLSSIGVAKQSDGTLTFDAQQLATALTQSPDSVAQIFASADGVAVKLYNDIGNAIGSTGGIGNEITSLNTDLTNNANENSDLDEQMATIQANYTAQFTALETMLAQLQTTSNYLTQEFTAMQNAQKNS